MAQCFRDNDILLSVDITSNRIAAEGTQALAEALLVNEKLQILKVSYSHKLSSKKKKI